MLEISKEKEINFEEIFGKEVYNRWLGKYPILQNKDIESWIRDKVDKFTQEGKDAVKFKFTSYIGYLQQYCDYNKTNNPSVLLEEKIDNRNLRLKKYLTFLYNGDEEEIKKLGFNKRPSNVSIRNMIQSRIKSYFSNRGSNISYGMTTEKSGENKGELKLTKELIRQIQTKLGTINYKLICKFMNQTGLRIGDVLESLTNGKYVIEELNEHYYIKNFKTFKEQVTINYLFFTEELSDHLKSATGMNNLKKVDLTTLFLTKKGKRVSKIDFQNRLKEIVKQLNINEKIRTHGLRKYFSSQVRKCKKLDIEFKEHLMGHMGQNLSQAYNNNLQDIDWFFKQWKQIEQLICVDCIVYDRTNKTIIKLETEIATLKDQKDIAITKNVEMMKRMDGMEMWMKNIRKAILFDADYSKTEIKEMMMGTYIDEVKDMIPTKEEEIETKKKIKKEPKNK